MSTSPPILTTKLYIPPGRLDLVPRPRLTARLIDGLTRPLTLVSGPAGSGKTTLVGEWWNKAGRSFPLAWLSLDADDNDPTRFLTYLVAALATLKPGLGDTALAALQASPPSAPTAIITALIPELETLPQTSVLVLDDYHVVIADAVQAAVAFLIDHLPAPMHLVLLTRVDPFGLPLARLRARNQVTEIRAADLRFTPAEADHFLNQVMNLELPAEALATLATRTEGWVAGLQLAALSLQRHAAAERANRVTAFGGSHHYIVDYLAEEVLKAQPEGRRAFLLQTSILGRLCGSLCEAVVATGPPQPIAGQAVLETLEHQNLFLIPLDDQRHWYRYHHLFADVLGRYLEQQYPQQLPELHRRASEWHERNETIPEAIHHALMAGDQDRAAQLVEQHGCELIMRGEVRTLARWIEAIEAHTRTRPWLAVQKAWALSLTGQPDQVEPTLQAAAHLIAPLELTSEVKILLGTMAAARAHAAIQREEAGRAVELARQALDVLPDDNPFACSIRSTATSLLGDASWVNGDLEAARHAYLDAARIGQAAGNVHMVIIVSTHLADVLLAQGHLHQAARLYTEVLERTARPDGQRSALADQVYAGLSTVSYEWNHLAAAEQAARQCLELCQQWGNVDLQAESLVMLGQLAHVQARPGQAAAMLRAAEQLAVEQRLSRSRALWVKSALARWCIAQGNLERAASLIQPGGLGCDADTASGPMPQHLTRLRLFLAQGQLDAALALSQHLLPMAEAARRTRSVIEILVLQALVRHEQQEQLRALETLERALALAQPEGYVRTFLDEGAPMARLLYQAKTRQIGAGYPAELLSTMGRTAGVTPPPAQLLIEPLTPREIEVLKLIEAGCSNQDIAARLVISIPTVKRHLSNIYVKLGAAHRTQAVARGRELGLFE